MNEPENKEFRFHLNGMAYVEADNEEAASEKLCEALAWATDHELKVACDIDSKSEAQFNTEAQAEAEAIQITHGGKNIVWIYELLKDGDIYDTTCMDTPDCMGEVFEVFSRGWGEEPWGMPPIFESWADFYAKGYSIKMYGRDEE
jgi:hypothetical protein